MCPFGATPNTEMLNVVYAEKFTMNRRGRIELMRRINTPRRKRAVIGFRPRVSKKKKTPWWKAGRS